MSLHRYMLNNKEPFLFFASIPPYTKLVPFGIMDSNCQNPKKCKKKPKKSLNFDLKENVWGKPGLHGFLGYSMGNHGIYYKQLQNVNKKQGLKNNRIFYNKGCTKQT